MYMLRKFVSLFVEEPIVPHQPQLSFKTIKKNIGDLDLAKILTDYCVSQKGEDFLVNLIFKNKKNGTFIDIGAHDGVRFSNSFAFSKLGWAGICVEAHPDYYKICCNNRENDSTKIYNVACANVNSEDITFYSNYRGSLSTLNPNLNEYYKTAYKGYYVDNNHNEKVENFTNGKIQIKSLTMNTIIDTNYEFLNNGDIDLISIDVDGSEESVLGGFDILKYKPRVIIFEVSVVRSVVENYMKNKNYYKLYDNNLNAIYCRDNADMNLFQTQFEKIKNNVIITYDTGHPLDD